jgi:predicted dehydrogenase
MVRRSDTGAAGPTALVHADSRSYSSATGVRTASKEPRVKPDSLGVAVVGTGGIGRYHVHEWATVSGARLVGLCDQSADAARAVADKCKIPRVYESLAAAVGDPQVDIVDVCTPNRFHQAGVIAALDAGKHCVCEKPLAVEPAEIEAMIAARDRSGRLLMTCQQLRFEPPTRALRQLIDVNRLGDVYYARAVWHRRRMVPTSPGLLTRAQAGFGPGLDLGVHMLDLSLHLMGFPAPQSVTGFATQRLARDPELVNEWGPYDTDLFDVEDFAGALVRLAGDAVLMLEASWLFNMTPREQRAIWLHGTRGGAAWPDVNLAYEEAGLMLDATPAHLEGPPGHRAALQAFVDAIESGGPSPVPPEESLIVARILDALYASAAQGTEVRFDTPA